MASAIERVRAFWSGDLRRADDRGRIRPLYAGRNTAPLESQREHITDAELERIIGRLETLRAFRPRIKDRRVGCSAGVILGTLGVWALVTALRTLWPGGGGARDAIWIGLLLVLPVVFWRTGRLLPVSALPEEVVKVMTEFGRCAACAYLIRGLNAEPDGCTVCPECGAAWRLG